jgi:hypothetical protein
MKASFFKANGRGWRYLIKWKGYEECTWLWADELSHAQDLIAEYHAKHPRKNRPPPPSTSADSTAASRVKQSRSKKLPKADVPAADDNKSKPRTRAQTRK